MTRVIELIMVQVKSGSAHATENICLLGNYGDIVQTLEAPVKEHFAFIITVSNNQFISFRPTSFLTHKLRCEIKVRIKQKLTGQSENIACVVAL